MTDITIPVASLQGILNHIRAIDSQLEGALEGKPGNIVKVTVSLLTAYNTLTDLLKLAEVPQPAAVEAEVV